MNRLVIILPYFGKFTNYFQLFLNSCAYEKPIKDVVKDNMDKFNIMKYGVDNRSKIFTMVSKCIGYTNAVRILILFQKIRERIL